MRRFKLINGNGSEYDMNDTASFFQNVDGLGFERKIESAQAGYDFIETDNEPVQKRPRGEMSFKRTATKTAYEKYQEFIAFCAVRPLVLCYMPTSTWYFIDIKIERIGKTEIDRMTRRLICPVDFLGLSTWYDTKKAFRAAASEGDGKTYTYTYPYTYVETAAGSTEIENKGHEESPCILHVFGEAVNPSWALVYNGVTTLTGKVNATISAGNKLVVNASPKELEIAEYTSGGAYVQNLYQDSDFSTDRFLMAPKGKSIVSFSHEGTSTLVAVVEVKQLADTV